LTEKGQAYAQSMGETFESPQPLDAGRTHGVHVVGLCYSDVNEPGRRVSQGFPSKVMKK
jgi:hypothetical protein